MKDRRIGRIVRIGRIREIRRRGSIEG